MILIYEHIWNEYEAYSGTRIFEDEDGKFFVQERHYSPVYDENQEDWTKIQEESIEYVLYLMECYDNSPGIIKSGVDCLYPV